MIAFRPWIGDRYQSGGFEGVRLLILGESQYKREVIDKGSGAPTPACAQSTIQIVKDLALIKNEYGGFFTKTAKLFLGKSAGEELSDFERERFWQCVAFYNFLQWWLSFARDRPTEEMWSVSQKAFTEALQALKPDLLVVLGIELAQRVLNVPASIVVVKIPHPSSNGFTYDPWSTRIREGLEATKSRRAEH